MAFEHKDNSGSLFKNDKRTTENHPQMTGKALIGGVEYWLSAWTKEGSAEKGRWQSLSFTPVERPAASSVVQRATQATRTTFDDMPDDIPF